MKKPFYGHLEGQNACQNGLWQKCLYDKGAGGQKVFWQFPNGQSTLYEDASLINI